MYINLDCGSSFSRLIFCTHLTANCMWDCCCYIQRRGNRFQGYSHIQGVNPISGPVG
uniref:Uncharacterized protein n=1 Tax=Rhizophora mucronata TaxID=61149 RepID=A0A2P2M7G8_RHIMU